MAGHIVSPPSGRYPVSDNVPDVIRYGHRSNASLPGVLAVVSWLGYVGRA